MLARICYIQCSIRSDDGSSHVSCHCGMCKGGNQRLESDRHKGVLLERPQTVFAGFADRFAAISRFLLQDMFAFDTVLLQQRSQSGSASTRTSWIPRG